jgi:ankyrin repeat protein
MILEAITKNISKEQFPTACSAVIGKSVTSLERILRATPSVANTRQMNGTTTLLHLAVETGDEDIVYLLLKYQASMEAVDEKMETAFHLAVHKGFRGIAVLLLKNGAKID